MARSSELIDFRRAFWWLLGGVLIPSISLVAFGVVAVANERAAVERRLSDEYVARLRLLDVDRSGQCMRPAAGKIGARFLDLLDGRARNDLIVAVHHRFQHDSVAGLDAKHRRLGVVEPAPLRGLKRGRQQMHLLAVR